ncbi:MAG: PAS domain S-box protein, partial [Myxococcota bacterium]
MKEIDFCNNPLFQKAILNSTGLLIVSLDREGNVVFINDSGAELLGYKPERVIGKNWFEQFLPDDIKDEVFNIFRNIIKGKIRKFKVYQNAVQTKDKNVKYIQFTNSIVKERGKIVGTIGVGIDVTQNKIASDKLSKLLMISQILIKTSYRLSGVYDINRIASVIVNAAKKLTNSKYGYLGYIDEESGYFYIPKFSREIMDECRLRDKQVVFKEFKGLWGWSLKNKKPILVNDITRDKRSTGVPEGHIKIKRFLALPVIMDKELIGQLAVANSNRDYTDEDIEILQRVVNLYIPSYQAAKYYEMEREILKRYTISLGASNQIVNMFNLDTKKVIFEGSLERIFGFTKEELPDTFEKFLEFIHPDDREIFIKRLAESKEFIDMQLRFRKKDGDFIYIQLRGYTSIERKTGERLIYGIISDISDRIRFEDEIIRREREIREIFENMPVPVVVMDKFRNIIFVNREFTRNYGYKKEDIQDFSKWVRDAFTFASKEEIDRYINFVFESKEDLGEEQNIIIKMIGKDGNWFYIKILKRIIGSNVVLILEDITEQKFREKKISLINTLLQINTEVNREISKIDSTVEVMKRVVKIFSNLEIFKEVHSFCFTDEQPRKLLDVTVDNVSLVKGELPDCIKNASGGDNSIVVKMEDEICSGCQFHKNNEGISTIVLSIKDENLPYGTLNLSLNKSIQIEGEAENILKGIARDIAFRITNIHLQYKNKEYIERIRNLARIPFENPNPLIRISDNGVLIYANPASQSLIKCWGTAVGEPVPDFVKSDIEYAFSINKVYEKEYQVEDKIFNAYIVPFKDTKYVNIYFNDITEKKKKEIELLESEERFRKLFYEAPDGFYLMDEEGKFLDGNAAAEEITGYKREELIGKNFIESGLIPEDKLASALDFFKRSILNGESGPFEQEIIKKDGSRAVLELFVRYIELQGKRVILGMARDVTDRIRMQNEILRTKRELERLNENLELEVEKKTYQIKKSEKMALIIKNIIITASNLADVDEIMKESGYYLAQSFDFKAYGYYLSERKDYSPNLFLNGSLCKMEIDRDIFNENVLINIARHFCNVKKVERLFPQDMDFLPEFIEQLQKNCLEILIVPVHYKEICYGFLFFFVAKGTDIDEILIEGFEQIGLQIGAVIRQKKTEEERERISRLHESILRSAGDGIIGTDAELNITFINESALKVLGYNSNDVVGVDICKLLHTGKDGLIHKENECAFAYVCDLKKDIEEEGVKFVRAGGEIIYVDKRIAPIIENGNFTGLVVVFRDITEEKRRREEINRFAVALNQYPIAIAFIDRD